MRRIIVLLVGMLGISSCSTTNRVDSFTEETCWVHETHHVKGITNTLNLCVNGDRGSVQVEYPNVGDTPTICYQEGKKQITSTGFSLKLSAGKCKNRRKLAANQLRCSKAGHDLICKDLNGFKFEFANGHNKAKQAGAR